MKNDKLISILEHCIKSCDYSANACLRNNHVQEMVNCMRVNNVCAEVCSSLRHLLLMEYEAVEELVQYCIKVCDDCAVECAKHDLEQCIACTKASTDCAKACREFLTA